MQKITFFSAVILLWGYSIMAQNNHLNVEVNNASTGVGTITNLSADGFAGLYFNSGGTLQGYVGHVGTGFWVSPGTFQLGCFASQDMTFLVESSERMRLTTTGRVGIGIDAPEATLDVFGPTGNSAQGEDPLFYVRASDAQDQNFLQVMGVRKFAGTYNLELFEGNAFKPLGGSWAVVSDISTKRNIKSMNSSLSRLLRLRPVTFEYKNTNKYPSGIHNGFIAQEVEKVFPEWITQTSDGLKSISIYGFEALAVEALKELKKESDIKTAQLTKDNEALLSRILVLEKLVEELTSKQ